MGRVRVVWTVNFELHGGSPRLCRLRTVSVGPSAISNELCTNAYEHGIPINEVAQQSSSWTITYLA
jgi:hypothetical protein